MAEIGKWEWPRRVFKSRREGSVTRSGAKEVAWGRGSRVDEEWGGLDRVVNPGEGGEKGNIVRNTRETCEKHDGAAP